MKTQIKLFLAVTALTFVVPFVALLNMDANASEVEQVEEAREEMIWITSDMSNHTSGGFGGGSFNR